MKAFTALLVLWAGVAMAQSGGLGRRDEPPPDRETLEAKVPLDEDSHAVKIPAERLDTKPGAVKSSPQATSPAPAPAAPVRRSDPDTPAWASGPALTPEEIRAAVQAQEEAEAREQKAQQRNPKSR